MTIGVPFYFSYTGPDSSYFHIIPFYGVNKSGNGFERQFVLGPVYINTKDTSRGLSRQDILFPIFSHEQEKDTQRTWLFPLYYHRENPDYHTTLASPCLLPPYYYTHHDAAEKYFHVWPFFGHTQRGAYEEYSSLWPFIRFGKGPQDGKTLTQVGLFYKEKTPDKSLYLIFPVWWHRQSIDMISDTSLVLHSYEHHKDIDETKSALIWLFKDDWAVFTYQRKGDQTLSTRFLWQVVSYEKTSPASSEFRFLWRLIRKSTTPQSDVLELNPFYYHETNTGKNSYWAILGGLIGQETMPDGSQRMRYFWVF